jgi:hypothetical protein
MYDFGLENLLPPFLPWSETNLPGTEGWMGYEIRILNEDRRPSLINFDTYASDDDAIRCASALTCGKQSVEVWQTLELLYKSDHVPPASSR